MENARRTAIAEELGLTLPTITTSVNEMLTEGILEEIPITEGQLVNNMGRRPNAIAFRAEAAYAIGVELGPYATRAVLMNLRGEVIESTEYERAAENYQGMLGKVANIIQELMDKAGDKRLLGVGVGLPGFIDREKGIIRSNPRGDWIGKILQQIWKKSTFTDISRQQCKTSRSGAGDEHAGGKTGFFCLFLRITRSCLSIDAEGRCGVRIYSRGR